LKKSCDRLAAHRDYRLAWIGFVEGGTLKVSYKSHDPTNYLGQDFNLSLDPLSSLSQGPAGRSIRENGIVLINDTQADPSFEPWRERARVSGFNACIAIPLHEPGHTPIGALLVYSGRKAGFETQEIEMLEELAGDLSFAINSFEKEMSVRRLEQNLIKNYENTIVAFVNMIELRDTYTAGHSSRVSMYSGLIAEKMGYSKQDVEKLTKAGTLHDIGKIVTPDTVLLNPGRLSDIEYDLIKQHVTIGYEFLSKIEMYSDLADIIRYHHERYDGNGYPAGASGDDIPMLSAIMAVADAFDAMTTERIYKPRLNRESAIAELQNLSGSQFHPEVIKYAVQLFRDIEIPKDVTQLPLTFLERKRFSYFFNDKLTGLFNDEYLRIILNSSAEITEYSYIYIIMLREFSGYNRAFGWNQGNELLREISAWLTLVYPETLLFRVKGDIFTILTKVKLSPDPHQIVEATRLKDSGVRVEMHSINMRENPGYWPDFLVM
jgi:putative nucleotidyltransferase with HDIG domain